MMGQCLSYVASDDVGGSAREKVRPVGGGGVAAAVVFRPGTSVTPSFLPFARFSQICQFFRSGQFKSALSMDTKLRPSLARRLLQRFEECFGGDEYSRNVEKCVFRNQ